MTYAFRSRRALVLAALVIFAPRALFAQGHEGSPGSFTLDAVMSAPHATELVAAPNGRAVAWLCDEARRRNGWVPVAPPWRARPPTSYLSGHGPDLCLTVWSAD